MHDLPWMSDATKKAAEEKLAMIPQQDRLSGKVARLLEREDRARQVCGNTKKQAAIFERNYNFAKLGKPVDEKEWGMTPPTVNAYYDPSFNDINFPAGILQPPFFDFTIDPAVNFGGIGVVIGHEMTHGFDDEGSHFDGKGNLREWWTRRRSQGIHRAHRLRGQRIQRLSGRAGARRYASRVSERASHVGREHG